MTARRSSVYDKADLFAPTMRPPVATATAEPLPILAADHLPAPAAAGRPMRATQIRFDGEADAYLAELDAEHKRLGRAGHISQSAVVRYALARLRQTEGVAAAERMPPARGR